MHLTHVYTRDKCILLIASLAGMHVQSSENTKVAQRASLVLPGMQQLWFQSFYVYSPTLTKSDFPLIKSMKCFSHI